MFETLYDIGRVVSDENSRFYSSVRSILKDNILKDQEEGNDKSKNKGKEDKKTILIKFSDEGDYIGTESFESKDLLVYPLSNRGNVLYSPFMRSAVSNKRESKIKVKDIKENVRQQIEKKLNKVEKDILSQEEKWVYHVPRDRVVEVFNTVKDRIVDDVIKHIDMGSEDKKTKEKRYDIAIKFGDYSEEEAEKIYGRLFDLYVHDVGGFKEAKDGICAVCGRKTKVSGKVNPYAFYTVNSENYAPESTDKNATMIYPVCHECAKFMFIGQMFADQNLVLPLDSTNTRSVVVLPKYYASRLLDSHFGSKKRRKSVSDHISAVDKSIETISEISRDKNTYRNNPFAFETVINNLSKISGNLCYTFLFLSRGDQKNDLSVLGMAVDVPPSRLRRFYEAIEKVRNMPRLEFFSVTKTYFDFFDFLITPPSRIKRERNKNPLATDLLVSALMGKFRMPKYNATRYIGNMLYNDNSRKKFLWYARDTLAVRKFLEELEKRFS